MANGGRHGRVNACFPRARSKRERSKDVRFVSSELVPHPSERLRLYRCRKHVPCPSCALVRCKRVPRSTKLAHCGVVRKKKRPGCPKQVRRKCLVTRGHEVSARMSMVDFFSSSFHDKSNWTPQSPKCLNSPEAGDRSDLEGLARVRLVFHRCAMHAVNGRDCQCVPWARVQDYPG